MICWRDATKPLETLAFPGRGSDILFDTPLESVRLAPSGATPVAAVTLQPQRNARGGTRRSGQRSDTSFGVDTLAHLRGHDRRPSPISKGGQTRRSHY